MHIPINPQDMRNMVTRRDSTCTWVNLGVVGENESCVGQANKDTGHYYADTHKYERFQTNSRIKIPGYSRIQICLLKAEIDDVRIPKWKTKRWGAEIMKENETSKLSWMICKT